MDARQTTKARYGFDFAGPFDWAALEAHAARAGGLDHVTELRKLVSLEDARFLLEQLAILPDPVEIEKLSSYQSLQNEWGGGFHGMLPEQFVEEKIPVPADFPSLLQAALLLAGVRAKNLEALRKANPAYPVKFTKQPFPAEGERVCPLGWNLELDFSAIREVLELFRKKQVTQEEAAAVATLPAFAEMMQHRRNLGYIPDPLITKEGLADFLYHAASHEPLNMLWKWFNTQNFFDLADIFLNREEYEVLVETLESHADALNDHILGTIGNYATQGVVFRDRLTFTVGWGISGWATSATGGINIEHFKDNYDRLLLTLTHETFHRFQLQVCPSDPSAGGKEKSFETIASFPFALDLDRKFYEVLTYIFLEGTATFVAAAHPPIDREESIRQGGEILAEAFATIYTDRNVGRAEEIANNGLRSNGPFYWFGARIAESIVAKGGNGALAAALTAGAPAFFVAGFSSVPSLYLPLKGEIESKTRELMTMMQSA